MATLLRLMSQANAIDADVRRAFSDAEENREREYYAAIKIQSWYRGIQARCKIRRLDTLVVIIQRYWRGFIARKFYRLMMQKKHFETRLVQYHRRATLIQKMWRGYYTRKYVFNYYTQKRYLEGLIVVNEALRRDLRAREVESRMQEVERAREVRRKARDDWLQHNHHLLSTSTIPGVYAPSRSGRPSRRCHTHEDAEAQLRRVKVTPSEDFLTKINPMFSLQKSLELDSSALPYYCTSTEPVLPPLDKRPVKPQGPFRATDQVLKQRYKPFQPSLRVQSDYLSLENAREVDKLEDRGKRIQDEHFQHRRIAEEPYDASTTNAPPYGVMDYGTKHFRELQDPPVPFKAVLPPIPLFEHFNQTYSRGAVGL